MSNVTIEITYNGLRQHAKKNVLIWIQDVGGFADLLNEEEDVNDAEDPEAEDPAAEDPAAEDENTPKAKD